MKEFDTFIAIDWSGALKPVQTPAIAVAQAYFTSPTVKIIAPPSQKFWSRQDVADYILNLAPGHRYLIGIDCNFGYAHSVVKKQFGKNATAKDLWAGVHRICQDEDNFSAARFWTHKTYQKYFWHSGKKPENFSLSQRIVETQCAALGLGSPESPFKLIGPKQVGKGGLSGMRLAHSLMQNMPGRVAIWPYDSKERCEAADIVITEIYPRLFHKMAQDKDTKIRDWAELQEALSFFRVKIAPHQNLTDHLADAIISAAGLRFLAKYQPDIHDTIGNIHEEILGCEGWIWGVPSSQNKAQ